MTRFAALLAGLWAGLLIGIGAIGAPAGFAVLATPAEAGRVAGRMFAAEAYLSLAVAMLLYFVERRRARDAAEAGQGSALSANLLLVFGALFCTVAGYFAVLPLMEAARAGQGRWSFGALHGASTVFYGLKTLLVVALAWRLTAGVTSTPSRPPTSS